MARTPLLGLAFAISAGLVIALALVREGPTELTCPDGTTETVVAEYGELATTGGDSGGGPPRLLRGPRGGRSTRTVANALGAQR